MKAVFELDSNNTLFSKCIEINNYIISRDGFDTGVDIANHQQQSVYYLLSHKVVYMVGTAISHNGPEYIVCKGLLISEGDGNFSYHSGEKESPVDFYVSDGYIFFTEEQEAYIYSQYLKWKDSYEKIN